MAGPCQAPNAACPGKGLSRGQSGWEGGAFLLAPSRRSSTFQARAWDFRPAHRPGRVPASALPSYLVRPVLLRGSWFPREQNIRGKHKPTVVKVVGSQETDRPGEEGRHVAGCYAFLISAIHLSAEPSACWETEHGRPCYCNCQEPRSPSAPGSGRSASGSAQQWALEAPLGQGGERGRGGAKPGPLPRPGWPGGPARRKSLKRRGEKIHPSL